MWLVDASDFNWGSAATLPYQNQGLLPEGAMIRGIRRAKERDFQVASVGAGRNTSRKILTRRLHAKLKRRERRAPGLMAYDDGQAYELRIPIAVDCLTCGW